MVKLPHSACLAGLALLFELMCPIASWAQLSDGAKAAILMNDRYSVFLDLIDLGWPPAAAMEPAVTGSATSEPSACGRFAVGRNIRPDADAGGHCVS
jgi:hypothetical protein